VALGRDANRVRSARRLAGRTLDATQKMVGVNAHETGPPDTRDGAAEARPDTRRCSSPTTPPRTLRLALLRAVAPSRRYQRLRGNNFRRYSDHRRRQRSRIGNMGMAPRRFQGAAPSNAHHSTSLGAAGVAASCSADHIDREIRGNGTVHFALGHGWTRCRPITSSRAPLLQDVCRWLRPDSMSAAPRSIACIVWPGRRVDATRVRASLERGSDGTGCHQSGLPRLLSLDDPGRDLGA
jgi:hypothetical protein